MSWSLPCTLVLLWGQRLVVIEQTSKPHYNISCKAQHLASTYARSHDEHRVPLSNPYSEVSMRNQLSTDCTVPNIRYIHYARLFTEAMTVMVEDFIPIVFATTTQAKLLLFLILQVIRNYKSLSLLDFYAHFICAATLFYDYKENFHRLFI